MPRRGTPTSGTLWIEKIKEGAFTAETQQPRCARVPIVQDVEISGIDLNDLNVLNGLNQRLCSRRVLSASAVQSQKFEL